MNESKPCPLCGSEAEAVHEINGFWTVECTKECTLEVSRHEVLGDAEKTTSCKWSGSASLEVVSAMLRMMQEVVSE